VNGALEASLGQPGTDLLLRAINVSVWLGSAAAYLRVTGREHPLSYLKLRHNAPKGLAIGSLIGLAFVAKDLLRVLFLDGRLPELAGLSPLTFLSPFVEEVMFRGLVLQRAEEYTGFWRANAISAGLFVGVHLPGWIFAGLLYRHPVFRGVRVRSCAFAGLLAEEDREPVGLRGHPRDEQLGSDVPMPGELGPDPSRAPAEHQ
jgi:membrane protease YdiL (CAAX protease family)